VACRGCSQSGDCACVVVGDGNAITVDGTGAPSSPYEVIFDGTVWVNSLDEETPNTCTEELWVLAKRADNSVAMIPFPRPCAKIL
jgi:hypothetical protein